MKIVVEAGRYLIGESGVYIARVLYKKESRGETFLVLDGGMNHHLAASGNLGQILKKNFPIAIPEKMDADRSETVNIVGPLCTPIDRLASKATLPLTGVGDIVAIFSSGAYGYSTSPLNFLSHPEPEEIIVKN